MFKFNSENLDKKVTRKIERDNYEQPEKKRRKYYEKPELKGPFINNPAEKSK